MLEDNEALARRAFELLFPRATRRQREMQQSGGRFVHYTSAEAAASILRNEEVWMRRSSTMNDFMEVTHGLECLRASYNSEVGKRLKALLNDAFPGILTELEDQFNARVNDFEQNTYLIAISEHLQEEDDMGRLSMWRAYGGATGVALVMVNAPFFNDTDALKAYTSPVAYMNPRQFAVEFEQIVSSLEVELHVLSALERDMTLRLVFMAFKFAALCTKHPGFAEEREWRIVHSPSETPSAHLKADIQVIQGAPQPIYKIPLQDIPEEGYVGATIPALVERIIIGPTEHPRAIRDAFVQLLAQAGAPNAADRVIVSDIPLRQ